MLLMLAYGWDLLCLQAPGKGGGWGLGDKERGWPPYAFVLFFSFFLTLQAEISL